MAYKILSIVYSDNWQDFGLAFQETINQKNKQYPCQLSHGRNNNDIKNNQNEQNLLKTWTKTINENKKTKPARYQTAKQWKPLQQK